MLKMKSAVICTSVFLTMIPFQNCGKFSSTGNVELSSNNSSLSSFSAPTVSLESGFSAITKNKNVNFQFDVNGTNIISVKCILDSSTAVDCSSGFSKSDLSEGSHQLKVTATDGGGLASQDLVLIWIVDSIPPTLSFVLGPTDVVATVNFNSKFSVVDNGSGIDNVICTLNDSPLSCNYDSVNGSGSLNMTNLTVGPKSLKITAKDKAENSFTLSKNFEVNLTVPSVTLTATPAAVTNSRAANFSFTGKSENIDLTNFECSRDGINYTACNNGAASFNNLSEGNQGFYVRSIDSFGRKSAALEFRWVIDLTPPSAPVVPGVAITNQMATTVTFSSVDPVSANVTTGVNPAKGFICTLNSTELITCQSPQLITLRSGINALSIKAVDRAGNQSPATIKNLTLDLAAPVIAFGLTPLKFTRANVATFTFFVTDANKGTDTCYLDNAIQPNCNSPISFSNLASGAHSFKVTSVDLAGNTKSLAFDWTIQVNATAFPIGQSDLNFGKIIDVVTDSIGNFYVADSQFGRIRKFNTNGQLLFNLGVSGKMAIDGSNNFYVGEGRRLRKFDSSGNLLLSIDSPNNDFSTFTVDSAGTIYGLPLFGNISKYSSNGTLLTTFNTLALYGIVTGMTADTLGNIYLADVNNQRIQKFNSVGQLVLSVGSRGSGDGQFVNPEDVAVDAAGNIYVADVNARRVSKFNSSGTFLLKFGSMGTLNGQFEFPWAIAIDPSGNIYVGDDYGRVQKFSALGRFLTNYGTFVEGVPGKFKRPSDVATDSQGNIYVADMLNNRVQKFNASGAYLYSLPANRPTRVLVDSANNLYVNDNVESTFVGSIKKFSPAGSLLSVITGIGEFNNSFFDIVGFAIDSNGSSWVLSNDEVKKITPDGRVSQRFGSGLLKRASEIAIDAAGNVYVTDTENYRVVKFNSAGTIVLSFGKFGFADGEFYGPRGITLDPNGNIYISSPGRIQKFDSTGKFLMKIGSISSGSSITGGSGDDLYSFNVPDGLSIDPQGNLIVADSYNNRVLKFSSTGIALTN